MTTPTMTYQPVQGSIISTRLPSFDDPDYAAYFKANLTYEGKKYLRLTAHIHSYYSQ
jgi:hypothetical protein